MKTNKPNSEPTRQQVEQIIGIVHGGDVYRERGGLIYKNGGVTEEDNPGICRSVLILDWDSYDWDKVAALWISSEIDPPTGYQDECCGRCITQEEAKVKTPPLDFVSPGQKNWSNAFNIPIALYQPASPSKIGVWDYYDPSGQTIGINFYPQSERAGVCGKDPKSLNVAARTAVEFIRAREALIATEYNELANEYQTQTNRCLDAAEQTLAQLQTCEPQYEQALAKINAYQRGQSHQQPNYGNWRNVQVKESYNPVHTEWRRTHLKQASQAKASVLSPSADPFEFPDTQPEKLGIPIQAYSRWKN